MKRRVPQKHDLFEKAHFWRPTSETHGGRDIKVSHTANRTRVDWAAGMEDSSEGTEDKTSPGKQQTAPPAGMFKVESLFAQP